MPRLVETPPGFTPNPRYAECTQLFEDRVDKILYPRFLDIGKRLMANRVHNSEYVKINLFHGDASPSLNFRITLADGLLDDVLCTAQARIDTARHGAQAVIEKYRTDPSEDLFVSMQAEYIHQVVAAGQEAYGLMVATQLDLAKHPAAEERGLDITLLGAPPLPDARRLAFSIHFQATVHRGWNTCPTCSMTLPSGLVDHAGKLICLAEDCRVKGRLFVPGEP